MTFYTCLTAVARQYLVLWRRTSTELPAAHQHLCTARCPWDLEQLELLTEKAPDDSLVIRAWVMGHMHRMESSQLNWPAPCLVQTTACFSACRWYIHWTSDYFLILFILCSVWRLKYNITSAVHMITRSLKEHTGFTEIPGRLGKAHLLGQIMFFLKALMVLPLMDVTMNASNNFYGIVYRILFNWIYCFYPWKNTFPCKKHLGLIDILQLSESPVIFLSSIKPDIP